MTRALFTLTFAATLTAQPATQPAGATAAPATVPLAQRIAHTDATKFRPLAAVHRGAGRLAYMSLVNANAFDTNHYFLHRGVIEPKSGIGVHFHNQCEEMFVIFDGEAQFTIDGRTSTLKGPAGVPTRMGHSHAIYNATARPVQWMNINVTALKGVYDAFDLGDTREGAPLDVIPTFMSMRLDRALLGPMSPSGVAKGTAQYRRALGSSVFLTTWSYVDHILLAPGAATSKAALTDLGETFYVMAGNGTVSAGNDTAPIAAGDALPIRVGEAKAFENTGTEPLELMVIGVARDMQAKTDLTMSPSGARGALAVRAYEIGLVNRVVSPEALDAEVETLARCIASKSSAVIASGKQVFYRQLELSLGDAYGMAGHAIACDFFTEDGKEGVDAFLGKRAPRWKNRQ